MKVWSLLLALVVGFALLPSCREKSKINNQIVVTAIGIDAAADGLCKLSIQAIETLKTSGSLSEQSENATRLYEIEAPSVAAALEAFVTTAGRTTYILHNRVIAIGMSALHQQSLVSLTDYFVRNHEGRPLVDMVVCRDSAAAVLEVPSTSYTIPAEHLSMLLQKANRRGHAVRGRLLDVERTLSGMWDAALPIASIEGEGENRTLKTDGTALFRDGWYVGELDDDATRGLLFARGDLDSTLYTLELNQDQRLTVEVYNARTSVRLQPADSLTAADGRSGAYTFTITCDAGIVEESAPGSWDISQLPAINAALSARIRADVEQAIAASAIAHGSDVIALKRTAMKQAPSLIRGREYMWNALLPDCTYTANVVATVRKIGVESGETGQK